MKKTKFSFNKALFLIWLLIFIFIGVKAPAFFKPSYIINVMLRNIVELGMVALPMTMIIVTGGIDLSVGNTMILAAMLGGIAFTRWGSAAAILVTILTGAVCGLINGVIISKLKISPMVTTLATMYVYLGLARGISEGNSVYSYGLAEWLGNAVVAGLPVQSWLLFSSLH